MEPATPCSSQDCNIIGFHNVGFTWNRPSEISDNRSTDPSRRGFNLNFEGDVHFKPGALNLITGPTGSGKTSLLLSLLGELHSHPLASDSWYNLPRTGGVAYAAQSPWILNQTIKVRNPALANSISTALTPGLIDPGKYFVWRRS